MVDQGPFVLEQFMDQYENDIEYNLGETCCYSLSLCDLEQLTGRPLPLDEMLNQRLAYTWIKGSDRLRALVAGMYGCQMDDVVVTNGAIGANFLAMYALVGPGDHVVVVDPTYQQLSSVPEMFGAEVSLLPLREANAFLPDLKELASLVRPNTKMIVINNPSNPAGSVIPTHMLENIVEIAQRSDAYVLSDEVYRPLFHSCESVPKSIVELYAKGISTGSMSKAFSLAGIRLGWVVSKDHNCIAECLSRRDFNAISVSCLDDIVACYALEHRQKILDRNYALLRANIETFKQFLKETGLQCIVPQAGTTAFLKVGHTSMDLALKMIKKHHTLVVPGETFGHPGFLRIGLGNSESDVSNGLQRLSAVLLSE